MFLGKSFAYGDSEDYSFEVQFGNIIVGKAEVSVISEEKKITVKAKTRTSGFLNTFYEYQGELIFNILKNRRSLETLQIFN